MSLSVQTIGKLSDLVMYYRFITVRLVSERGDISCNGNRGSVQPDKSMRGI